MQLHLFQEIYEKNCLHFHVFWPAYNNSRQRTLRLTRAAAVVVYKIVEACVRPGGFHDIAYLLLKFGQLFDFFNWQKKQSKCACKYCNCVSTLTKVTFLVTDFSQNAITIAFYGDCPLFSPLLLLFQFWPKRGHDMKDLIEI